DYKDGSLCVSTCPEGKYSVETPSKQCNTCLSECETCSDGNSCDTCKASFYKNGSSCVSTCPAGKYPVSTPSKQCLGCLTGCATCSDGTSCDTCQSSYF